MAIDFTLTQAGIAALQAAEAANTTIHLAKCKIGSGQYTPTGSETDITTPLSPVKEFPVRGKAVEVATNIVNVEFQDSSNASYNVGEIGIFSDTGVLIWIASRPAAQGWLNSKVDTSFWTFNQSLSLGQASSQTVTFSAVSLFPDANTNAKGKIRTATATESANQTTVVAAVTPEQLKINSIATTETSIADEDSFAFGDDSLVSKKNKKITFLNTVKAVFKKISSLTEKANLSGSEDIVILDGTTPKHTSVSSIQGKIGALTDAATIAWNVNDAVRANVTLGGNRTLGAFTNGSEDGYYLLRVKQDATGNRTLTLSSDYDRGDLDAPELSTAANDTDVLMFGYFGGKRRYLGIWKGYGA